MKSVYQIPFVIALFIGMALNVGALVAIFNWEEFTWQVVSLLCILVALLIDLYLLGAAFSKKFVSTAAFYISLCAEIGLVAVLYLLYSMQQIELLLWLYFGLVILWHLISILILGMSIFDQSHFWVRMRKRIEPVNLLVLSFTFLLFTPFFYELYSRFDYESQREIAITTALQRENIRFDLYAQLFESIDEPLLKFKHFPNVSLLFQNSTTDYYRMSVQTNSLGFRDDEFQVDEIREDDFVVLFLGDSVTFGVGVEADETFVEQSELLMMDYFQWQKHDTRVLHINMGVGSYGLIEVVEALKYIDASKFKPDVIIYSYNINDYSDQVRGLDQETGALVPFKPRSFFLRDMQQIFRPQSVDMILTQKLDELRVIADQSGAELMINILPAEPRPQEWPSTFLYEGFFAHSYQFIQDYVMENNLPFVDSRTVFRTESQHEYLLVRPNYRDDGNHYNQLGHQLMGQVITLALLNIVSPKDSLAKTVEAWGNVYLESGNSLQARKIYELLFQSEAISSLSNVTPSPSLQENYSAAMEDTLLTELTIYLNFSGSTVTSTFDQVSKIPNDWEWEILPECPVEDCSVQNCIESECSLLDNNLGLLLSEEIPYYHNFPSTSLNNPSGSILFWYQPEEDSSAGPVARLLWSYWADVDNRAYINLNKEQGLVAGFKTDDWYVVSSPVNWQAHEWHHIVMTWDEQFPTLRLYIDSQLVAYSFKPFALPETNGRESLSGWPHDGSVPANGYFRELLIFPNKLSQSEINWLYTMSDKRFLNK